MNDKIAKYKNRKKIVADNIYISRKIPNNDEDTEYINKMIQNDTYDYDFTVTPEEAKDFLIQFKKEFNDERFNKLVNDCKKEVISSIVTPFGLGQVVAAYDKTGGNVDTIHNVRNVDKTGIGMSEEESLQNGMGIYATEEAKQNHENKEEYSSKDYHDNNPEYSKTREANTKLKEDSVLIDGYTGQTFDEGTKDQVEHIIAAKEVDDDTGRVLANVDGSELANRGSNLTATSQSVNGSKQEDSAPNFLKRVAKNKEKIQNLEAKQNLTPEEEKGLARLKRVTQVDEDEVKKLDKKARNEYNKEINKAYYTSKKFVKNTIATGGKEGAKMGMQQALGLIITEFFTAIFDEILDIYKNGFTHGFDDDRFFSVLKDRLNKISKRVSAKWKDAAIAFKDGFISGFISNLATTVINMFITTGKRVVRIIREGVFSLFKAVKLLTFPPEGMSYEDAMHEAKKLIASGLIVTLGVIAEEYIDKLIRSTVILEPFADVITAVFVGAITGLSITMVVYYIEKNKNDKDAIQLLMTQTDEKVENIEQMLIPLRQPISS